MADATTTGAGYVGEDVENIVFVVAGMRLLTHESATVRYR